MYTARLGNTKRQRSTNYNRLIQIVVSTSYSIIWWKKLIIWKTNGKKSISGFCRKINSREKNLWIKKCFLTARQVDFILKTSSGKLSSNILSRRRQKRMTGLRKALALTNKKKSRIRGWRPKFPSTGIFHLSRNLSFPLVVLLSRSNLTS